MAIDPSLLRPTLYTDEEVEAGDQPGDSLPTTEGASHDDSDREWDEYLDASELDDDDEGDEDEDEDEDEGEDEVF